MAKKQSASSVRAKPVAKSARPMPDRKIDFSDVPESSDEELRLAKRVGRPRTGKAKQLIAIRIDPTVLSKLRRIARRRGKPYQTFIHELLDAAVKKVA